MLQKFVWNYHHLQGDLSYSYKSCSNRAHAQRGMAITASSHEHVREDVVSAAALARDANRRQLSLARKSHPALWLYHCEFITLHSLALRCTCMLLFRLKAWKMAKSTTFTGCLKAAKTPLLILFYFGLQEGLGALVNYPCSWRMVPLSSMARMNPHSILMVLLYCWVA